MRRRKAFPNRDSRRRIERLSFSEIEYGTSILFPAPNVDAFHMPGTRDPLAKALADTLHRPGWYADFRSARETFVVFPDRVFRCPRGDDARREETKAHGRMLGIPDSQLDWPL